MKVQLLSRGKVVETEQVDATSLGFVFTRILPGKYLLKLHTDDFCWQQDRFDIDVQDEDVKSIEFVQTGYAMYYNSTHGFEARIRRNGKDEKKRIGEGQNQKMCFEQRGKYVIVPDSCYKFA